MYRNVPKIIDKIQPREGRRLRGQGCHPFGVLGEELTAVSRADALGYWLSSHWDFPAIAVLGLLLRAGRGESLVNGSECFFVPSEPRRKRRG